MLLTKEHDLLLTNLLSLAEGFESEILGPVRQKAEQIKPRIIEMDKNHIKIFKKLSSNYSNKKKELNRIEIKLRKKRKNAPDLQHKKELKIREIEIEGKILEDSERKQISEISEQERDLYETIGNRDTNWIFRNANVMGNK